MFPDVSTQTARIFISSESVNISCWLKMVPSSVVLVACFMHYDQSVNASQCWTNDWKNEKNKLFDIIQSDHWCNSCCLICTSVNKGGFFHRKPQPSKQILKSFVILVRKIRKWTFRSENIPSFLLSKVHVFPVLYFTSYQGLWFTWDKSKSVCTSLA